MLVLKRLYKAICIVRQKTTLNFEQNYLWFKMLLDNYLKVTTQGHTNEPVNFSQYHLSCLHCVISPSYSVS